MAVFVARELESVAILRSRLQALLDHARALKPQTTVAPPLPTGELLPEVDAIHEGVEGTNDAVQRQAAIETAAREVYYGLITSTDIEDPAFVEVWNLLDILQLCGDQAQCAPELVCWLLEELLDSQTTHGCRIVFDYLESRRERLARKDFHKKNLIFLRSCNELLRRLSRAEDAIFCGRVFFFLFQTFPLGDKSSVNLRGEFHVENTTIFEGQNFQPNQNGEQMDIDSEPAKTAAPTPDTGTPQSSGKPGSKAVPIKAPPKKEEEIVLSSDELYPIFWRLQQNFSDPTRLFKAGDLQTFKVALERTITKFKKTPTVVQTHAADPSKRGKKRKAGEDGTAEEDAPNGNGTATNYNPKYLTSRDLFELELSDLAFQRHILVQSLILIDFLLSLTEKAKQRIAGADATNKSLLYSFTLSEEDSKWASVTRKTVTEYISSTNEGRLFNRMVETVLARDKNWVRWKLESCPSIVKGPVPIVSELEARANVRNATKLRPLGPSNMDLSFLEEGSGGGLEELSVPSRYQVPSIEELLRGIQNDELDLEMEADESAIASLKAAIENKRWRIVREARANRLQLLDKIEPGKGLDAIFETQHKSQDESHEVVEEAENHTNGDASETTINENGETPMPSILVNSGENDQAAPGTTTDVAAVHGTEESKMETE